MACAKYQLFTVYPFIFHTILNRRIETNFEQAEDERSKLFVLLLLAYKHTPCRTRQRAIVLRCTRPIYWFYISLFCQNMGFLQRMASGVCQRHRKEDEAAGAANQKRHYKTGELTQNFPVTFQHFSAFFGKILILPTCHILINSFYLVFKESRKPSLDRSGGLYRSKFQMYTRKIV